MIGSIFYLGNVAAKNQSGAAKVNPLLPCSARGLVLKFQKE